MNLKACTFERLTFVSLGFGRGALVGKTSLLEVEFIYGASVDVGRIHFLKLVRLRPWDPTKTHDLWKKTTHFFTMRSEDSDFYVLHSTRKN